MVLNNLGWVVWVCKIEDFMLYFVKVYKVLINWFGEGYYCIVIVFVNIVRSLFYVGNIMDVLVVFEILYDVFVVVVGKIYFLFLVCDIIVGFIFVLCGD